MVEEEPFETILTSSRSLSGIIASKVDQCFQDANAHWLRRESDLGGYYPKIRSSILPGKQEQEADDPFGLSFYLGLVSDFLLAEHSWFHPGAKERMGTTRPKEQEAPPSSSTASSSSNLMPTQHQPRPLAFPYAFPYFDLHLFYRNLVGDFCNEFLYLYALIQLAMHVEVTNVTPGYVLLWLQRYFRYPNLAATDRLFSQTDNIVLPNDDPLLNTWPGEDEEEAMREQSRPPGTRLQFKPSAPVATEGSTRLRRVTGLASETGELRRTRDKQRLLHVVGNADAQTSSNYNSSTISASTRAAHDDANIKEDFSSEFFYSLRRYSGGEFGTPLTYMYSVEIHFWLAQLAEKEFRMKLGDVDIDAWYRETSTTTSSTTTSTTSTAPSSSTSANTIKTLEVGVGEAAAAASLMPPHDESTVVNSASSFTAGNAAEDQHAPALTEQVTASERSALQALLRGIHDLCEAFKIPYVLAQGTLLGAMRHHALVPWTGDAEVAVDFSYVPYLFLLTLLQTSHLGRITFLANLGTSSSSGLPRRNRDRNLETLVYRDYYDCILHHDEQDGGGEKGAVGADSSHGHQSMSTSNLTQRRCRFLRHTMRYEKTLASSPGAPRGTKQLATIVGPTAMVHPNVLHSWFTTSSSGLTAAFDIFYVQHQVLSIFVSRPLAPKFFFKDIKTVELASISKLNLNMNKESETEKAPTSSILSTTSPSTPHFLSLSEDVDGFYHRYPYLDVCPTYFHEGSGEVGYTSFAYGYRFPREWVYPRKQVFLENVGPVWAWNRPEKVLMIKYGKVGRALEGMDNKSDAIVGGTATATAASSLSVPKKNRTELAREYRRAQQQVRLQQARNMGSDSSSTISSALSSISSPASGSWLPNPAYSTAALMEVQLPEEPLRICVGHHLSHKTMVSAGHVAPKKVNCSDVEGLPIVVANARPVVEREEMMRFILEKDKDDEREGHEGTDGGDNSNEQLQWKFRRCESLRKRVGIDRFQLIHQLCFFEIEKSREARRSKGKKGHLDYVKAHHNADHISSLVLRITEDEDGNGSGTITTKKMSIVRRTTTG
ncbi:unnamed protein product [Amoebophrya sp. A25]|nr:unnamed protein product [Amoebophrya sp. A25]|eukprot:GSA25T00017406001.1